MRIRPYIAVPLLPSGEAPLQRKAIPRNLRYFIVLQSCPVFADIGPYIQVCVEDAYPGPSHAVVNSIYRGDDARALLNRHGKHSQYQLYHATTIQRIAWGILGTPNPPGHSSHELFSDGNSFFGVPNGGRLAWWQQGFDVLSSDSDAVIAAAHRYRWDLRRPYSAGVEVHHLTFHSQPKRPALGSPLWLRLQRIRATYPRR